MKELYQLVRRRAMSMVQLMMRAMVKATQMTLTSKTTRGGSKRTLTRQSRTKRLRKHSSMTCIKLTKTLGLGMKVSVAKTVKALRTRWRRWKVVRLKWLSQTPKRSDTLTNWLHHSN